MTSGEKSFTKTGRMRRASFTDVCQWVLNAWSRVKTSSITGGFRKAGLLRDEEDRECSSESDKDETEFSDSILKLFHSDTEEEDFEGFSAQEEEESD